MTSEVYTTTTSSLECVEVFFKCNQVLPADGSGGMVDFVSNCEYNPASQSPEYEDHPAGTPANPSYWMVNGTTDVMSISVTMGDSIPLNKGRFPDFGLRSIIIFACGIVTNAGAIHLPFGNGESPASWGNEGTISISMVPQMHGLIRGRNELLLASTVDPTGLTMTAGDYNGTFVGIVGEYIPATTDGVTVTNGSFRMRIIGMDGTTKLSSSDGTTPLDMTLVVNKVGSIDAGLSNKTRFSGLSFYSILAFSFNDGLPTDRETVYNWMMRHHSIGDRSLPPQWISQRSG